MAGTDPQLLASGFAILLGLVALLASAATWYASRAKKVRLLEDQVLSAVRAQRERADQVETKLAEWQVAITGTLAEVEEFFERTVKERKRTQQAATRAETAQAPEQDFVALSRDEQKNVIRGHFEGR